MKKVCKYLLFSICIITFSIFNVKAENCPYNERKLMNQEASNIKINYEIKEQNLPDGYYYTENGISDPNGNDVTDEYWNYYVGKYAVILINNLPEDLYFKIEDESLIASNNNKSEFSFSDTQNGYLELKLYNLNEFKNLSFAIYSANPNCNTKIMNLHVKVPRYNEYYATGMCQGIQDYKYCQEFLYSNISSSKIVDKITAYKRSLNTSANNKKNNSIMKPIVIILSVVVCGFLILAGTLVMLKKRRKK